MKLPKVFSIYARFRDGFLSTHSKVAVNQVEGTPALIITILLGGKPYLNWVLSEKAAEGLRDEINAFLASNEQGLAAFRGFEVEGK